MGATYNSTGHELRLPNIVSGAGVLVFDGAGNQYLDLTAGVWCISVGHNHERVNAAIRSQLEKLAHAGFSYTHPIVEKAAKAVLSVCGMEDGGVVFLGSGSEAIDYARQAARKITGHDLTLTFHDAYLGSLSSATDRSGWLTIDWTSCERCSGGRRQPECTHLDDIPADVAEFVFEPGSSAGQVRFAPAPFVRSVAALVKARGGKVIANEVTTGIGRTGKWFGHQHHGITPDLIVLGKGLGNGYPVSAVVMDAATRRQLEATDFKYMQSHQNDPLGAAVVKEVLAIVREDGLVEQAAHNGAQMLAALQELSVHPAVKEVRGRGLMCAIDLVDEATASHVFGALLERGYIVCLRGATLRIDPPLTTPLDALHGFVVGCAEILDSADLANSGRP